ncbi:calmodulin-like [Zingiber officinale]|uniref:calmodulin-like n=1 Tax=Zingiber officinale TaxID=94328 RepID=UPI001C4AD4B2|nr:calmodulin-like [Zingiber officinale]
MEHLLHLISHLFDALHCRFEVSSFFLMTQEVRGHAQLGGAAKRPVVSCSSGSRKCRKTVATTTTTTDHDVEVVMRRLLSWNSGEEDGLGLMEEACRVLQEKEASVEELEEAFAVFDGNGDGKVGAEELMGVMERLGLEEGARVEECERMIAVYDEDGDGAISFREFMNMLMNS